jgi:AsmA protein
MRNLKFLGGLAAGVVVLLCAALVGVWLMVNPNHYKDKIAAAVKESTGRELRVTGDIKLSVFPWVALELGPASVGNPPGFSEEPFLSFTHAVLRVKLLPLLRERLEIARVEIDGLDVRLRRNAQGRGNWQDAEGRPNAAPKAEADPGDDSRRIASRPAASLANLRIQNGRLSYEGVTLENITLETGSAAAGSQIPVSASFDGNRGVAGEQLSASAKFDLSEDATGEPLRFAAVNLSGTLARPGEGRPSHWDLSAPDIKVDLTQQTAAVPAFTISYSSAHLNGSVSAAKILDDASVTGTAILAPLILREFAPRFGLIIPKIRDAKALSQLSASTDFAYGSQTFSLSNLQLRLDDTAVQGSIQFHTGEARTVEFDLTADQIDLDRYRAPEGSGTDHESGAADGAVKSATPLEARGTFNLKAAQFARQSLSDLRITLAAKDKVMRLFPIEAQIDGGRYSGDITLDSRGAVPTLTVDEHLTGVDMARLLANSAQKGRLSGHATLNLKATAQGDSADAFLKTLSGHLEANLADGAVKGIDVGYEIGRAQALIDRSAAPARDNTGQTKFETFNASAQITDGMAETRDLTIATPALKVTGQGRVNLSTKAIDFQLLAAISTAPDRTMDIPLKVAGTYSNPTVRPDIEAAAKDQLRQKLQDVLKKNGLQGLFSK